MHPLARRLGQFLLIAGALLAALPQRSSAQSPIKRIAFFSEGRMETHRPYFEAFREGLRKHGYIEGRNVELNAFWGDDTVKPLGWLASDVVGSRPDVIVTTCAWTTKAAQRATTTIPIIFAIGEDPVASGLVKELARPGGNVTGLSQQDVELTAKRLDLLKQAVPKLSRVGVLYPPDDPGSLRTLEQLKREATKLRIEIVPIEAWEKRELVRAFESFQKSKIEAFLDLIGITVNFTNRKLVAELALRDRLPTMFFAREFVEDGGLMSYGPNHRDMFRHAANYVDRILKGAKAGDLPIEQPTRFELVINLKTAKALGIKVPQSLLIRADRVID